MQWNLKDMKKILLCSRSESSYLGGDQVQLRAYQTELKKLGYEVEFDSRVSPDVAGYDEVWIFHMNYHWSYSQYEACRKAMKPYYLFANFCPWVINNSISQMVEMITNAKKIFCLSLKEKEEMCVFLKLKSVVEDSIKVIPNGVDKVLFYPDKNVHEKDKSSDVIDEYVLTVGGFELVKGQRNLIEACSLIGLPVVCVGDELEALYKKSCKEFYDKAFLYDRSTPEELSHFYRGARVYVCASNDERNNLPILEAGACGCRLVSSNFNKGNEWLNEITSVNPNHVRELADAIQREWNGERKWIDKILSWKEVVEKILIA